MFNTRLRPFVAVLVALVPAALGLAACGGGGDEDVDKLLQQTFGSDRKVQSGRIELSVGFKAEGGSQLGGPVQLKLTGPFQSQGAKRLPRFDFDLTASLGGAGSFQAGAVSTGDKGFLKFQGQTYAVPDDVFAQFRQGYERSQRQREGSRENPTFASLGVDPRRWLKGARNEGDADVAGTETIHIAAGVDVAKLLEDVNRILSRAGELGVAQARQLPTRLTERQRKQVREAIRDASFDVYTGKDDKVLRRLRVALKFEVPERSRRAAGGLRAGEVTFDLVLAGLDQPQKIGAPASARPFDELTQALRQALSGLGAGGGAAAPGGTGGGDRGQDYARCIAQAGGDIAKAQKCQSLLSGG